MRITVLFFVVCILIGVSVVADGVTPGGLELIPQAVTTTATTDCDVTAASGNIIAMSMEERGDETDYNGDGDTNDRVLGYYDVIRKTRVNTGITITQSVSIDGDIIAFQFASSLTIGYYSISTQTLHDTGITPSTFGKGSGGNTRVVSNGRIAYVAARLSGDELFIYDTVARKSTRTRVLGSNPSFNGDVIAFVSPSGNIAYYTVSTGKTVDTLVSGENPTIDKNYIVFDTTAGVTYYDIAKGIAVLTPIQGGHSYSTASISNGIIAAVLSENGPLGDLDGDGDTADFAVLVLYDIATGRLISTGVVACCGPDISNGMIVFDTYEGDINEDLNGDGDTGDCVQRYVSIDGLAYSYFGRSI